jgi:hypothetical protein
MILYGAKRIRIHVDETLWSVQLKNTKKHSTVFSYKLIAFLGAKRKKNQLLFKREEEMIVLTIYSLVLIWLICQWCNY